jgi:SHS2 domain-containing protein
LSFTSEGNEGRIDLIHLDVPDQDYDGVDQGWEMVKAATYHGLEIEKEGDTVRIKVIFDV